MEIEFYSAISHLFCIYSITMGSLANLRYRDFLFQEGSGQWVSLDLELEMRGAEIIGTKKPTGHSLLIDCRLELPFGKSAENFSFYSV